MSRPPLKMTVTAGHLVPATPHDAERFDAWRQGTVVNVRFTRDKQRIGEVVWWAAITRAVKHCATPWKTADEASEAIKLALGIVNLTRTVKGAWASYPKSLTELDEPELDEAVERLFDVLYGVTGVHCEDWREQARLLKEAAAPQGTPRASKDEEPAADSPEPETRADGAATDQQTASAVIPCAEDAAGSGGTSPCDAAADHSLRGQLIASLKLECISKMLMTATDDTISKDDRDDILEQARGWWAGKIPGEAGFVKTVFDQATDVSNGKPAPSALRYLRALAAGHRESGD